MLIGVITGLIWWQSAGSDAEQGALFFFVAHMTWWPGFLYLFAFPAEVAVLTKERLSHARERKQRTLIVRAPPAVIRSSSPTRTRSRRTSSRR